jgi:Sugar (and other) transporter
VGAVNVLSTLVAVFGVDRLGRRVLLLEAGVQMFIAEILVAILLGHYFASEGSWSSDMPPPCLRRVSADRTALRATLVAAICAGPLFCQCVAVCRSVMCVCVSEAPSSLLHAML